MSKSIRVFVSVLAVMGVPLAGGCGGFAVILPSVPEECFQEDVVATDCFTETRFVEVCEEDFFGYITCYDEAVVDVYCEDVLLDSYIVCE
jgi:hypothetical protein